MKKVFLFLLLIIFSSCKDIHKMNLEAEKEASEELKSEELNREIKRLEYENSKLPKTASEINYEISTEQKEKMDNDKNFIFYSYDDKINFKYKSLKKVKFTLSVDKSEVNGMYKIYLVGKELKADALINYKHSSTDNDENFIVSGELVKKQ